jgi:glycosidase
MAEGYRLSGSNIYEVNLRQYTNEGTFNAFAKHLPRLKAMGVEILWFMPVHPIGRDRRKGLLGSYYSIMDFHGINAEFGTEDDFHVLIMMIHSLGMKVMLDWVANHASWDNVWTKDHPEFFCRNSEGGFMPPYDWDDVIQIDHSNEGQQLAMITAMEYWVKQFKIDGFRADLAHLTPLKFWIRAKDHLQRINKDLIWLAETEEHEYHQVFDISFTWEWMHTSESFVKNRTSVDLIRESIIRAMSFYPDKYRLYFTSNHDENSWNGTEYEKYGHFAQAFAVISCTLPGSVPLLYSGQEIPNQRRLIFFDKDHLEWTQGIHLDSFYKNLFELRKSHHVFHSIEGFTFIDLEEILCYIINCNDMVVCVLINLSVNKSIGNLVNHLLTGEFQDIITGSVLTLSGKVDYELISGGYLVLANIKKAGI